MKRKLIFVISFLAVLAAVIGPALYAQKITGPRQTPELSANSETNNSLPGGQLAGGEEVPPGENAQGEKINQDNGQKIIPGSVNQTQAAQVKNDPVSQAPLRQKESSPGNIEQESRPENEQKSGQALPGKKKENGCSVEVAVVGINGELLYGPKIVTVTEKNIRGITALGALEATGLPYSVSASWANFVEEIAGQRNKGQAGWMYKVNEEIPLEAADQKEIKDGDQVIWWYSKNMATPPPQWENLRKQ